jgi:high-affinity iron transporter
MLRLILTFSIAAAVAAQAQPARALPPAAGQAQPGPAVPAANLSLRRAVALLDYVAGDYAHAVGPAGDLLSQAEHQEQVGFVEDAAREVRADAGAAGEDLAVRLDALGRDVAARAVPAKVMTRAKAIRDEIAQRFRVALLPVKPPDLGHGAQLYAQSCAACHGLDGHPNAQLELSTKPPDFAAPAETAQLAPQRIFSAVTYGVPKTAMPAFDDGLDDAQRWDLAFYVLTLSRPAVAGGPGAIELARAALLPTGYRELAVESDEALRQKLAAAGVAAADQAQAIAALRSGPFAEQAPQGRGLAPVRRALIKALQLAQQGDREGARRAVISAYLDDFEPHEPGLRARDPELVKSIEGEFVALRSGLDKGDAGAPAARLDALLSRADAKGPGGALVAFIAALAIALREGVEAALLVAAMLALLRKSGREGDARAVHFGWMSALGAGAVTWWLSGVLLADVSGAHRELVEGALQLVTAALLLYASHWLLAAASARKLVGFLSARTMAAGSALVVLGLTFAAVYREMFETVIFFRGLLLEAPDAHGAVAAGALLGLLFLGVLVALFQKLGRKLKPRPLLLTCGVLLCGLAVLMVGNGVRSLQEVGWLPLTVWGGFQLPALGIYATREGLAAQALVLFGLISSALWSATRGAPQRAAAT